MKKVIWAFQAAVFYLFTLLFATIPESLVQPAGKTIGAVGARLITRRRTIAVDNIRQALPFMTRQHPEINWQQQTPETIAYEMFRRLGISLVETCRLYHGRGKELIDRIDVRGREHLEAARKRGNGVIILTGHCGNWELAALALARQFNSPMSVVARRQDNPWLNRMVEKMRLKYDNLIIYKDNAFRGMLSVIRKNGIVGILVDQAVHPDEGALINFLGRKAWATKAPVLLACKTGATVLPAFIHREADRHVIDIYPELSFTGDRSEEGMTADVQSYSQAIANHITRYPTDWYWVHRRWKRAGEAAN
jgi:KDO2-lipid IV(A) lauroyltransferase